MNVEKQREISSLSRLGTEEAAALIGLFAAKGWILAGLLGLNHGQGLAIFPQQHVIAELAASIGRRGLGGGQGGCIDQDVELLNDLGWVGHIPTHLG